MTELQHTDLKAEDLKAWAARAERAAEAKYETPADAFFASPELRDSYSAPWNDHICLIDLSAFPDGPIEGLSYSKATPLVAAEGNVYQILLSEDGERLAIVSAFILDALKTGALRPEDLFPPEGTTDPGVVFFATAVAVGALKCAKSKACRGAVARGASVIAGGVASSAIWDGIKSLFD